MTRSRSRAALLPLLAAGALGCGEGTDLADAPSSESHVSDLAAGAKALQAIDGLSMMNGLASTEPPPASGVQTLNGLRSVNGLRTVNGLRSVNGLSSSTGLMTTAPGRIVVEYLVRCALARGDSITKEDASGVSYTFAGQLGLGPEWKDGACDDGCQQAISACMLAHVNTTGVHIPLWLVSPDPAIGWGTDPQYPNREGSFFGNIFTPNPSSGLVDAFYCNGPGFSTDVVPGRLGAAQSGAPYTDPYVTTNDPAGTCAPCASTRPDGPSSCTADRVSFGSPITVWRGQTFQAETAMLSPGLSVIPCSTGVCSDGYRVGNIGPHATVTFTGVRSSTSGSRVLIVYYADGDSCGNTACERWFNISVNGGPPQPWAFPVVKAGNWNVISGMSVGLTGFVAGTTNTITFTGDAAHAAPDLDWIEVE
jgi:hypothetical protein